MNLARIARLSTPLGLAAIALSAAWAGAQSVKHDSIPSSIALRLPRSELRTLRNGMRVVAVQSHSLPVVAARLVTSADSVLDPVGKTGLAALTAAVMGEATRAKSARQVQDLQASLGTHVTPTSFTTSLRNFDAALALMAEFVQQPAFSADAIAQQKAVMLRRAATPSAGQIALRAFLRLTLGSDNPFVRFPDERSISASTLDDVAQFHRGYVEPRRATLIVVGDVPPERVFAAAEKRFGNWRAAGRTVTPSASTVPAPRTTTIYLVDAPGRNQAVAYVGQPLTSVDAAHGAALDVMATILGSSAGSRIQTELRDRRGYMYVGTPYTVTWDLIPRVSLLWGFASLNETKVDSALALWLGALRAAHETVPTAAEMEYGRNSRLGVTISKFETADSVANQFADAVRRGRAMDWLEPYARDLQQATPRDVLTAANHIDLEHLTILVAGNRKVIEPLLRAANIAPVIVVDENGRPIS